MFLWESVKYGKYLTLRFWVLHYDWCIVDYKHPGDRLWLFRQTVNFVTGCVVNRILPTVLLDVYINIDSNLGPYNMFVRFSCRKYEYCFLAFVFNGKNTSKVITYFLCRFIKPMFVLVSTACTQIHTVLQLIKLYITIEVNVNKTGVKSSLLSTCMFANLNYKNVF